MPCEVRDIVGDTGLCCCVHVTSFQHSLCVLYVRMSLILTFILVSFLCMPDELFVQFLLCAQLVSSGCVEDNQHVLFLRKTVRGVRRAT